MPSSDPFRKAAEALAAAGRLQCIDEESERAEQVEGFMVDFSKGVSE